MHASSLENMWRCYRRYIAGGPLEEQAKTVVLDVGGADVNGSYRDVFRKSPFCYLAADTAPGTGVDIVLDDPYRLPLDDASADIVVSGQAFEHIEFFWQTFGEMARVVQPNGFIFLILPSAGPIHRYPVDCYRFYPDALQGLARHAGCVLIDSWHDERGPWQDLVGVFRRADAPPVDARRSSAVPAPAGWNGPPGTQEEEAVKGTQPYLAVLERLHQELAPRHYLEIGIRRGASLKLARGPATGVDPAPELSGELPPSTQVFAMTSDDFFAEPVAGAGIAPDFAFIDGMHHAEYALRDFMNIERRALPGAVVAIDDIFPNHPVQAERERRTRAWTGDVWRLVEVLRRHRPDLFLLPLDAAPSGLLLIAGLDPTNRVLWERYNYLVGEARQLAGPPPAVIERSGAVDPGGAEFACVIKALIDARAAGCAPAELVARLQRARDGSADAPSSFSRSCDKPKVSAPQISVPKISVVVVSYNMARELPRTIRSLSPLMQRGIAPEDYEVILIDNGSTEPFDEAELRALMPGLIVRHYPDAPSAKAPGIGFQMDAARGTLVPGVSAQRHPKAPVSPVPAINLGLELARGELVGVCIDGARIASPGLLATALAAARLHPWPVIGTISFHLGPTAQMESVKHGYDQRVEDALLAGSGWQDDGYRLFSIAAFAGSSAGGWFELPAESNAMFARAEHWRRLGGWDEGFVAPGGGLANLDAWARLCADPEGELIMLLGEATFHQVHGGIATNNPDPAPLQKSYHEEYVRLRGRPYVRPTRRPLYYGSLPDAVRSSMQRSMAS